MILSLNKTPVTSHTNIAEHPVFDTLYTQHTLAQIFVWSQDQSTPNDFHFKLFYINYGCVWMIWV